MVKTCGKCKEEKPVYEFHKLKRSKDGLQHYCKECHKESVRASYRQNPARAKAQATKFHAEKKTWLNEIKDKPCLDCGQRFLPCCMDFDHMDPTTKTVNVCMMISRRFTREKIQAEIDKCELVCSNCHRLRTHARNNGLSYDYYAKQF